MSNDSDDDLLKTGGALGVFAEVTGGSDEQFVGRDLGDYRITGLIAEGGMSRVYRAERTDGSFEREVAIKVSPVSGFNDRMRERFVQEQGVLAGLNHPNISQLYDTQVTEEGWPYIVMELVDGGPIDEFCSKKSIDNRVRLLIDVVDAVAFAHARLVVHRDIKPSNVLVNEDGRPKLLDFGIAKLLEGDEPDLTRAGPMTPRYASPEQLLGQPITIASDVYQLGLLIYEALTGEALNKDEALTTAIQRAAEEKLLVLPASSRDRIPRELVLIIEQCLRVSAEERYRDANALRDDLQAYLDGYPVSAAGQSAGYRFRKFISRNRPAVLIAATAAVAITGGGTWYTWQLAQARDLAERRAATSNRVLQTMSQLVADTFSGLVTSSAERSAGDESYIEAVLEETVGLIERELAAEPDARAELLRVQGTIETVLGNVDQAATALEEAYALIDTDDSPDVAMQILLDRIEVAARSVDMSTARAMLAEADALSNNNSFDAGLRARHHHQSGQVLQFDGEYEASVREFNDAIELIEQAEPVNAKLLAETYEELAYTYTNWSKHEEALGAAGQAIQILEQTESSVTYRLVHPLRYAGFAALSLNDFDTARRYYERAEQIAVANFGVFHPDNAGIQDSLGSLAYLEGRFTDAVAHYEEHIRILTELEGADSENLLVPYVNVSLVYGDIGKMALAAEYIQRVLEATASDDPAMERFRFAALSNEARRYFAIGDFDRAIDVRIEAIELAARLLGKEHIQYITLLADHAIALARAGRVEDARSMFQESRTAYGELNGFEGDGYASWSLRDWQIDKASGDLEEAERKVRARIQEKADADDFGAIYWVEMLADYATMRMNAGDFVGARQALDWAARGAVSAPEHPWSHYAQIVEADYWYRIGDRDKAIALAGPALRILEQRYPNRVDDIRRARIIVDS